MSQRAAAIGCGRVISQEEEEFAEFLRGQGFALLPQDGRDALAFCLAALFPSLLSSLFPAFFPSAFFEFPDSPWY